MASTSGKKDELIGTTVDDRYLIERRIGKGGMGYVYLAHQIRLKRPVAIKIPRRGVLNDVGFRSRFQREAHSMAKFQHENICQIFDVFVSENPNKLSYLVLEHVEGERLDKWIKNNLKTIRISDLLNIFTSIANGLDVAHSHSIIHRDIKPSNIMITSDMTPKIMDFGVAQVSDDHYTTRQGIAIGTPAYMSPEQVRGHTVGPSSDQYAFAMSLYRLFTGQTAFQATRNERLIYMQLHEPPQPPSELNPNLPLPLELIILKGLAKKPEDRFKNCCEMIEMMALVLGDHQETHAYTLFKNAEEFGSERLDVGSQFNNLFGDQNLFKKYQRELLIASVVMVGIVLFLFLASTSSDSAAPSIAAAPTTENTSATDTNADSTENTGSDNEPTIRTGHFKKGLANKNTEQPIKPAIPLDDPTIDPFASPTPTPAIIANNSAGVGTPSISGESTTRTLASAAGDSANPVTSGNQVPIPGQSGQTGSNPSTNATSISELAGPIGQGGVAPKDPPPLILVEATPFQLIDPNKKKRDNLLELEPSLLREDVENFLQNEFANILERELKKDLRTKLLLMSAQARDKVEAAYERMIRDYTDIRCTIRVQEIEPSADNVRVAARVLLRGIPKGSSSRAFHETIYRQSGSEWFTLESRQTEFYFASFPDFLSKIKQRKRN